MKKGFTLVEIIIVVALGIMIASMTFFAFYALGPNQVLDKETANILSYLERARSLSVSANDYSEYGVRFTSTTTTIFKGKVYSATDTNNTLYPLNKLITVSTSLTGGVTNFYFNKITGTPSATGTITVSLPSASSSKIITIYNTGLLQSN